MPLQKKSGSSKSGNKHSGKPSPSGSNLKSKAKKPAPKPVQQKSKPKTVATKKKPPHMRYTEKELNVPQLNGIRPAGIQKPPNAKKGKKFVDDKEQMNAILAMVMAEKEGNIESKMMRARQLEEVREARRIEAEKRVESKKAGLEERKLSIKENGRKRRQNNPGVDEDATTEKVNAKKPKKKVSFG